MTRGQSWEERWRRRGRNWGWKLGLSRNVGDSVCRGVIGVILEEMLIGLSVSAKVVLELVETERVRSESQLML